VSSGLLPQNRSSKGSNVHLTQALNGAANTFPNKIASIDGTRRYTWMEWRTRMSRLAAALRAIGIATGDRVAILSLNSDRYTEYLFAVWWAGGAVVPMNTRWSAAENAYSLNDSGAQVLFVDQNFAPMLDAIRAEATGVKTIIYMGDDPAPDGMLSFEDLIAQHMPCNDAMRKDADIAGLFYTGGTTGFPKGVMLSHRALWYNAVAITKELRLGRNAQYLHAAPMFHLADFGFNTAIAMVGGCNVYMPSFEPEATLAAIETHEVNTLLLVPTMLGMILAHQAFKPDRLRALEKLIYGASPMPEGLLRQALQAVPHVKFFQAFGQTELAPLVSILAPEDHVLDGTRSVRLRSAGLPVVGCEVKIIDQDGRSVPCGTVGEIVARSPGVMLGYWQSPQQTNSALVDGWVHTGDGAYQDEDGFIYIVDRMKDMIVSGGENVFSAEVESAISTHPDVAGVAVIGIPSDRWGETVHAVVVAKSGTNPTENSIIEHCKARIAGYKCPRSVTFRAEPFPLSGAGKVLKHELRASYWGGRARSVN
jgi:acyl-CoA synthetase (AMP-forming)/AMP-acid ligase II